MANLKEVRTRIASVNNTMQITSAMKMVSAAKLRRAQDAILQMRPYAQKMQQILANLSRDKDVEANQWFEERESHNTLYVAISSNRGLCGAFNANVSKGVLRLINKNPGKSNSVLGIGKKQHEFFRHTDYGILGTKLRRMNVVDVYDDLTFGRVSEIADVLMAVFVEGEIDRIVLVYNRFKNAASQILTVEQLLPVVPPTDKGTGPALDYIYEPGKSEILANLIPTALRTQLFKALLDSHAAEHGARMTAMHKATDNAGEMLHELRLSYNKARQAAITNEILEIVGGAEALDQ